MITDRILTVPSPFIESLTPLLTWLTLHKEDSLVTTLFEVNKTLRQDFSRIHKMLSNYCY